VLQTVVHQYGAIALSLLPFHFQARLIFLGFSFFGSEFKQFSHVSLTTKVSEWYLGLRGVIFFFFFTLEKIMISKVLFLREALFHKSVIQSCRTGTEFRYVNEAFVR
jgi:hypothetical protein